MDNQCYRKVATEEIAYLKAARNYCEIHLREGRVMTVSIPMVEVLADLSKESFIQVHRSYSLNLAYVQMLYGNTIQLSDKFEIPIGREYKELLYERFTFIGSRKRVRERNKQILNERGCQ